MKTTGMGTTPMAEALRASIAYELSEPLCAIVASAAAGSRWLSVEPPNLDRARRALERIANEGRRASEIIDGIRVLAQRQAPRAGHFDLDRAVLEVLSFSLPI